MTLRRESVERRQARYVADRAYMERGAVSASAFETVTRNPTALHNRRPGKERANDRRTARPSMLVDRRNRGAAGWHGRVAQGTRPWCRHPRSRAWGIPEERTSRLGPIHPVWSDPAASTYVNR